MSKNNYYKKTYIRIYCNDIKVRATGNEKWYREMVLNEFAIDKDYNTHDCIINPSHYKKVMENLINTAYFAGLHIKSYKNSNSYYRIPEAGLYTPEVDDTSVFSSYVFRIDVIQSKKHKTSRNVYKKLIREIYVPYVITVEQDSTDGKSYLHVVPFKRWVTNNTRKENK